MSDLYDLARRTVASITDATDFRPEPVSDALVEEMIGVATAAAPGRFPEPPWRFIVVVGEERGRLLDRVGDALSRHWGFVSPRGRAAESQRSAGSWGERWGCVPSSWAPSYFGTIRKSKILLCPTCEET